MAIEVRFIAKENHPMTCENFRVVHLVSAAMLALALASCASSDPGTRGGDTAIQNGVIVDDIRQPARREY